MCGLGFNGYDENGKAKWDRVNNVNILKLEVRSCFFGKAMDFIHNDAIFLISFYCLVQFATNMKEILDNWNICTALWLRRYVTLHAKLFCRKE